MQPQIMATCADGIIADVKTPGPFLQKNGSFLTSALPEAKETDRFSQRPARISLGKLQCFGLYHGLPGMRLRFRRNTTLGWSPDYNTAPVRPVDAAGFTKGIT